MERIPELKAVLNSIELGRLALTAGESDAVDLVCEKLRAQAVTLTEVVLRDRNAAAVFKAEMLAAEQEKLELRQQISDAADVAVELSKYEPHRTALGGICLRKKPVGGVAQPDEYLCIPCATSLKKTLLLLQDDGDVLHCREGHGGIPGVEAPEQSRPFIDLG